MTYTLTVDVKQSIETFYPGLTSEQVEFLSKTIFDNWDYSDTYTELLENIRSYATFNKIDLEGKDGVETSE